MGDVIQFPGSTTVDMPPKQILEEAAEHEFESLVILGFKTDGNLYTASSTSDGPTVLWLMERAKHSINKFCDELEAE